MNQRGSPLWLVCDVLCWIGATITLPAFAKTLHRIVTAMKAERRRSLHARELTLVARLLAEAEAWLLFAITRRAFHLAGLKRSRVRFPHISEAATLTALKSRARQLTFTFNTLDRRARQMARRLVRMNAEQGATTTPQQHSNNAITRGPSAPVIAMISMIVMIVMIAVIAAIAAPRTRAGMRVRAPPWRTRLPDADCRLPRSASFRGRTRMRASEIHCTHPQRRIAVARHLLRQRIQPRDLARR